MEAIWIFIVLVLLMIGIAILKVKERFSQPEYLSHKAKSFDAEKQMRQTYGDDGAWLGTSTKSFASEQQGVAQNGLAGGFIGKTMKYY